MRNQNTAGKVLRIQPNQNCFRSKGFTLVELLVVFAVIGILAALLLPALSKAKNRVQTLACLNNLKQLETSCHLYTSDFNDFLPPNQAIKTTSLPGATNALVSLLNANSWCPGIAPLDLTPNNVQSGLIFPYNKSPFIYHCPADWSTVNGFSSVLRTRSYSMDISLNCDQAAATYRKFTEIRAQSPANLFVLVDGLEQDIWDGTFEIFSPESSWSDYWQDVPADRHNLGADLSFADGHVEYWKWKAPKVNANDLAPAYSPADLADLQRLQDHTKPDVN